MNRWPVTTVFVAVLGTIALCFGIFFSAFKFCQWLGIASEPWAPLTLFVPLGLSCVAIDICNRNKH